MSCFSNGTDTIERKMKDSGIPWIGQIPENWEVKRLKDYFVFKKGEKSALYTKDYVSSHLGEYPVYSGQTESGGIMGMIDSFDYNFDECLFITTVGANAMSTKLLKGKFSLSQNCLIMLKKEVCECRFVNYLLQPLFDCEKSKIPYNTQPSLRCIDLSFYQLCMPSINTQQSIANYLDLKTSQIDSIISDLTNQNSKLAEYRKSLISEAVTKGLDKTVKMKDSGIPWIGQIPEDWEVKRVKNVFNIVNGATPKSMENKYWDGNIIWITPADYKTENIYVSSSKRYITEKGLKSCGTTLVPINSIVISCRAPIGSVALTSHELCTNQGCKVLVNRRSLFQKFYYYYFSVKNEVLNMLGSGTTFLELSKENLSRFYLTFPPLSVQQSIANYLDLKTSQIDSIIEDQKKLIELLKEYRKSVISEAVTGKVIV